MSNNKLTPRLQLIIDTRFDGNWAEFARFLDLNASTLQHVKGGKSISINTAIRISNRLGLSLDWLLTGNEPMYRDGQERRKLMIEAGIPIEDLPKEQIIVWLEHVWTGFTVQQKVWFHEQFKRAFPEFDAWLASHRTSTPTSSQSG